MVVDLNNYEKHGKKRFHKVQLKRITTSMNGYTKLYIKESVELLQKCVFRRQQRYSVPSTPGKRLSSCISRYEHRFH